MTDQDRKEALAAMQALEQATLDRTPPEKLGVQLRDSFDSFVILLEMAEKYLEKSPLRRKLNP
jgi:hypothetical protein